MWEWISVICVWITMSVDCVRRTCQLISGLCETDILINCVGIAINGL